MRQELVHLEYQEVAKIKADRSGIHDFGSLRNFSKKFREFWVWLVTDFRSTEGVNERASEHWEKRKKMNDVEQKLYDAGKLLGEIIKQYYVVENERLCVLAIPRSGWAVGKGVADALGTQLLLTNQGGAALAGKGVLEKVNIPPGTTVILVDDVVYSGRSVSAAVRALQKLEGVRTILAATLVQRSSVNRLNIPVVTLHGYDSDF